MADFMKAMLVVIAHEGGSKFTQIKHDRGGATKWGITIRTLRRWRSLCGRGSVSAVDVKRLTRKEAYKIYEAEYWTPCGCDFFVDQILATKVFDIAVNCGVRRAVKMLQRAINRPDIRRAGASDAHVAADGVCGIETRWGLDQVNPRKCVEALKEIQRNYYLSIIRRNPSQAKFRRGWLRRAAWPEKGSRS